VVLDAPEAVKTLHRDFLRAGSEVMLALTYYGHREKLRMIGKEGLLEELNRQAVRLAQEVAAEGEALVAGDISNTWLYDPKRPDESAKQIRAIYDEQIGWAVDEGIDFVVAETIEYLGEALVAAQAIKAFNLPAVVMLATFDNHQTRDGYSYEEACRRLQERGADVVGLNCTRGPATMLPLIARIRQALQGPLAALPVPYRTTEAEPTFQALTDQGRRAFPIGLDPLTQTRFEVADFAIQAQKMGVNYVGLCCGAGPHHIRAMAEALGRQVPASRYSPDMSRHPMLGTQVKAEYQTNLKDWKD